MLSCYRPSQCQIPSMYTQNNAPKTSTGVSASYPGVLNELRCTHTCPIGSTSGCFLPGTYWALTWCFACFSSVGSSETLGSPLPSSSWCWWTTVCRTPILRWGRAHFKPQKGTLYWALNNCRHPLLAETERAQRILGVQPREARLGDFPSGVGWAVSSLDDGRQHPASYTRLHSHLHGVPDNSVDDFRF